MWWSTKLSPSPLAASYSREQSSERDMIRLLQLADNDQYSFIRQFAVASVKLR